MYAQVLVFQPIRLKDSPFLDYRVPECQASEVQVGQLVAVPSARRHSRPGHASLAHLLRDGDA